MGEARLRDLHETISAEYAEGAMGVRVEVGEDDWKFLIDCTASDLRQAAAYERARGRQARREAEQVATGYESWLPLLEGPARD
jgi:hypothetical protein